MILPMPAMPPEIIRLPLKHNTPGRGLLLTTLALLALGVVMVHSAVASVVQPGPWYARVDVRHTIFAVVAAVVLLTAWRFRYHWLATGERFAVPAAVILVLALLCGLVVFVPGVGHAVGGKY